VKQVFLVDGHSIIYRSFYAFIKNPLRDSKGRNTSAVFGFVNSLKKLVDKFKPEYLAVAFDTGRPTVRHKEYKEYKSNRPQTPDELRWQVPEIKEIIEAYGLESLEVEGHEADDVLGSVAQQLKDRGFSVVIVTSDKDLMQLVSDKVQVYDPYRDIVYDEAKVKERFGVEPEKVADILALAGDAIDNIPGVPGIGEKRAQEIILKYGSVEAALDKEPRIKDYRDLVLLSKSLTRIRTDVEVAVSDERFKVKTPDSEKLATMFKELEFSSLVSEIQTQKKKPVEVRELTAPEELLTASPLAFSVDDRAGLFVASNPGFVYRLPRESGERLLSDDGIVKVGFAIKEIFLKNLPLTPPFFDLKIAAWLLDPNRKKYDFSDLLLHHLLVAATEVSPPEIAGFGLALFERLKPELGEKGLEPLFNEIEIPLIPVLADMEKRGTKIDVRFFKDLSNELTVELEAIERRIYDQVGFEFNLGSPKQLSKVLFETLKLKPRKKTKTGYSTDVEVLTELAEEHEVPKEMLRYRELSKLISTYLVPLVEIADPTTHRLHTSFHQTGTSTGRLSSSDPNLQNIPIRTDLGRRIRQGFIADDGFLLISADYSQIELRILAHLADEDQLKEAFRNGEDIHIRTACAVLGITEKEMTAEARRLAKVVNYGLVYGMSEWGLASGLGISQEQAQNFIHDYMEHYSKVAEWREKIVEEAEDQGYVRTLFGRIRPLPELKSPNRAVYEQGRRYALNTPIQGTAADIIKKAMIAIFRELKAKNFKGGLCLQIHDELVLEIEEKRIDEAKEIVKHEMEHAVELTVPLEVEMGVGKNWASAH
jgi:DNA polymerase-1